MIKVARVTLTRMHYESRVEDLNVTSIPLSPLISQRFEAQGPHNLLSVIHTTVEIHGSKDLPQQ